MLLADHSEQMQGRKRVGPAAASERRAQTDDGWARRSDLQRQISLKLLAAGLRPHKGADHALVMETIANADDGLGTDVNSVYKLLCDRGEALFMSKLYRVLKALEQVGLVKRRWDNKHGRPRSMYQVCGLETSDSRSRLVCRACGASTFSDSQSLGREIANAARQGGLPIVEDPCIVYVKCEKCATA